MKSHGKQPRDRFQLSISSWASVLFCWWCVNSVAACLVGKPHSQSIVYMFIISEWTIHQKIFWVGSSNQKDDQLLLQVIISYYSLSWFCHPKRTYRQSCRKYMELRWLHWSYIQKTWYVNYSYCITVINAENLQSVWLRYWHLTLQWWCGLMNLGVTREMHSPFWIWD